MLTKKLTVMAEKILTRKKNGISREEATELAFLPDEFTIDLIAAANKIRIGYKKNRVFTCSITNAKSGSCSQDCAFCAQSSRHKTRAKAYPLLNKKKLVDNGFRMFEAGATRYSIVTSGYMLTENEIETICQAATGIINNTGLSVCASLGMLTEKTAKQLKENGITRYHHNLETAKSYFNHICTTHEYEEDLQTIEYARAAGLEVCCGGILGLGESWDHRVELAFTLKNLDVDSIPLNFLNPIPGTKLENRPFMPPMEALKSIALFRFINPITTNRSFC